MSHDFAVISYTYVARLFVSYLFYRRNLLTGNIEED